MYESLENCIRIFCYPSDADISVNPVVLVQGCQGQQQLLDEDEQFIVVGDEHMHSDWPQLQGHYAHISRIYW